MKSTALSLCLFLSLTNIRAQEVSVPVDVQLRLFLKLLHYDRNLKARSEKEIVIGVVYQPRFRASVDTKDEFLHFAEELQEKTLDGIPFRCTPIRLDAEKNLSSAIRDNDIHLLYITPLRAVSIEKITEITRAQKVLTLTGVPEYVELGVAIGIDSKGQRPLIVVNVSSAKAEGADLSSKLLRLKLVKTI